MNATLPIPEENSLLSGAVTLPAPSRTREVNYDELRAAAISASRVVVLAGYSGAGYQHPEIVEDIVRQMVRENGDNALYVAGATKVGIGAAYDVIHQEACALGLKGVKTAGLVSELARANPADLADMDLLCFVPSPSWEVNLPNGWSANVDILRGNIQPLMACLGGGKVAATELRACLDRGFQARVYAGQSLRPNRATPGVIDPVTGEVADEFRRAGCDLRRAPCWPKVVQSGPESWAPGCSH